MKSSYLFLLCCFSLLSPLVICKNEAQSKIFANFQPHRHTRDVSIANQLKNNQSQNDILLQIIGEKEMTSKLNATIRNICSPPPPNDKHFFIFFFIWYWFSLSLNNAILFFATVKDREQRKSDSHIV